MKGAIWCSLNCDPTNPIHLFPKEKTKQEWREKNIFDSKDWKILNLWQLQLLHLLRVNGARRLDPSGTLEKKQPRQFSAFSLILSWAFSNLGLFQLGAVIRHSWISLELDSGSELLRQFTVLLCCYPCRVCNVQSSVHDVDLRIV